MKYHYIEGEWINALMSIFTNLGLDTEKITNNIEGFKGGRLLAGYRLEVSAARKMWHRADELAKDPLLGLKVGSAQNYRAIGVLAPVIWHSPNVHSALQNLAKFQSLISESGRYHLDEKQEGEEHIKYCEYIAEPSSVLPDVHQILAVVVGTVGIIRAISNNTVNIKRLYVPPNLNADLLAKNLGFDVVNRVGNFAICFATQQFEQPLLGCDSNLYRINLAYAEELLSAKKEGIALIASIKVLIESGGFSQASIEYVELSLGSHKRTLQRNLFEQGTSFRQLKEEVLKAQAVNLLLSEKFEIEALATHLGYSEPSAFHRAFKSWFGVTPRKFCRTRHYQL
jgi:AraC-like DNA-binding protein